MKSARLQPACLALALLTAVNAGAITYQIDGFLTASGSDFSALWTFDETVPDAFPAPEGFRLGQYQTPTSVIFSVGGVTIISHVGTANIWVQNNVNDHFSTSSDSGSLSQTPFGLLRTRFDLGLNDTTGLTLDTDVLPGSFGKFDLSDVNMNGLFMRAYSGPDYSNEVFALEGKITSVSQVPDAVSSAALLAISAIILGAIKSRTPYRRRVV